MESKNIKAIIFDMDGVLINSEAFYMSENRRFLAALGKTATEEDLYRVVGTPLLTTQKMFHSYLSDSYTFEEVAELSHKHWLTVKTNYKCLMNDGVVEVLSWLKKRNYKLAVASSSGIKHIQRVIEQCSLDNYFDVLLTGDMFKKSKPDPEIYLTAAKMLKAKPEQCIVIEDSVYGIEAGKRAGMKVIALKEPFGHDQSLADIKIDGLLEIIDYVK